MSDGTVLQLERLIAAPPERVFEYWTDPDLLVRWFGPEGYDIPVHSQDATPGGRWRTTMRATDGRQLTVSGVYRAVEPPHRLVFTWGWDEEDGVRGPETEVTVTFEPTPGGTRLVLQQQTFEAKESRDNHRAGWSPSLERLARVAA